jgi:bifunctional oligoribonuclease and PAP phosphatase NrnA
MKPIEGILPLLQHPQKIIITHHHNPDADALGSSLGLCHYLSQKGHSCQVISPNDVPDFILWMPGSKEVIVFEKEKERTQQFLQQADILFCLDFNQYSRTKTLAPLLEAFEGVKVMIDHHLFPDETIEYGVSLPSKSSTCEMVYDFINASNDNEKINLDIAKCLYAGLMTDTGSFKFPATTASCHLMVADLMTKGLETAPIHQAVFDTYAENRLRFLGYVLSQKMIVIPEQHAAIIAVSRDELNRYAINTGDTEGIVNFPLSMKNIIFSTFISERENEIRMSFRSKGSLDVNEFARTHFEGGGHLNASGGKSTISLNDTIEKIKNALIDNNINIKSCFNELV